MGGRFPQLEEKQSNEPGIKMTKKSWEIRWVSPVGFSGVNGVGRRGEALHH